MIATKNSTCTEIIIQDDKLEQFTMPESGIESIVLYYTVNNGTEQSFEVTVDDITDDYIILDDEFFGAPDTTICDGIYCFRLVITEGVNITKKRASILVDCTLRCALAEYLWNNPNSNIYGKHQGLQYYTQCHSCDCATMYELYIDLLCELNIPVESTECGCHQ